MKFILFFTLCPIVFGCSNPKSVDSSFENGIILNDSNDRKTIVESSFKITSRQLKYGNDLYTLRIRPYVDSSSEEFVSEVLLKYKTDTIFLKTVSTDSILNNLDKNYKSTDSINIDILKDYNLVEVVSTDGIRNSNSYLIGRLESKNAKNIYVSFSIKALYGETGKMWVNGCSYNSSTFNDYKN